MRRREALYALLSVFALPITPRLDQATAMLNPAVGAADTPAALGQLAGYVWRLGVEHMDPDSDPGSVQAGALAAWRDLHEVSKRLDNGRDAASAARCDALMSSGRAAALVAEVYADDGDPRAAHTWYNRARTDTDHAAGIAARTGDTTLHGEAIGVGALIIALYAKKLLATYPEQAVREIMEAWQRVQTENVGRCTAHALVPAVLARARAITGDARGARTALQQADQYIGLDDYPDTNPGELSILRYHPRSHHYTNADVYAWTGNPDASRRAAHAYRTGDGPQPRMNAALIALAESTCRLHESGPDAAAEHATGVLAALPDRSRTPNVMGRLERLTRRLEIDGAPRGGTPPVQVIQLRQALDQARHSAAQTAAQAAGRGATGIPAAQPATASPRRGTAAV